MVSSRKLLGGRADGHQWPIEPERTAGAAHAPKAMRHVIHPLHPVFLSALLISNAATICRASAEENSADGKFYRVVDGKVDARTFNGFRRYHGSCDHCHGPEG